MRRNRRDFLGLAVSFLVLGSLVYFVVNFGPDKSLKILNISVPTIPIFFILFFISVYELFTFILNSQRRGFLISFFATLYLILRMNNLTHPFFGILILALFITFELLFRKRK